MSARPSPSGWRPKIIHDHAGDSWMDDGFTPGEYVNQDHDRFPSLAELDRMRGPLTCDGRRISARKPEVDESS